MMLLPLVNPYDHSEEQMLLQYNNNPYFNKIVRYLAYSFRELQKNDPSAQHLSAHDLAAIMSMRVPISFMPKIQK